MIVRVRQNMDAETMWCAFQVHEAQIPDRYHEMEVRLPYRYIGEANTVSQQLH
jgi:hypothetical protein